MNTDRILLLGCGTPTVHGKDQVRRAATQAQRRGITLVGADTADNLKRMEPGVLPETVELDTEDVEACLAWGAEKPDIQAVVTFRELCVESAAALADALGLAGNPIEAVRTIRNKDRSRAALRRAGMPQPEFAAVVNADEAAAFMARTGPGPWVMKPTDGMGSVGVSLVADESDLPRAFAAIGSTGAALLETFVSGREFSAEGVLIDRQPTVLGITAKTTDVGFVETGHRMPSGLDPDVAREAEHEVARALIAVGATHGIFHVEFWVTDSGIVLGELHVRPGGDFIHLLVEETRPGLEFFGTLFDDVLGRATTPPPPQTHAAGVDFLTFPLGIVRSISGWDGVVARSDVRGAGLYVEPGDELTEITCSSDRHAVIAVRGQDSAAVEKALSDARELVHVVTVAAEI